MIRKWKLRWTTSAHSELTEIVQYIAHDSPNVTLEKLDLIEKTVAELGLNPHIGGKVPELSEYEESRYCELIVAPWRVIFEVEEGLQLAKRSPRREKASVVRAHPAAVTSAHEEWAMDFVSDVLHDGWRFRVFTLIDTHTRLALQVPSRNSMSGLVVTQSLEQAVVEHGLPRRIRCDNGPEFIGKILDQWCFEHGIDLYFIAPGKPTQNYFIESFNGTFRDECLESHWFGLIIETRRIMESWQRESNEERPHSSLGGLTPSEFAAKLNLDFNCAAG